MVQFVAPDAAKVNRVLAIGTAESLTKQVADPTAFLLRTIAKASATTGASVAFENAPEAPANVMLLKHAAALLHPTTDKGCIAQAQLVRANAGDAFQVTLFAVPTQVSRSNSLARPHAIHAFVKNNSALLTTSKDEDASKDQVTLVALVLPEHEATWLAAGAAVARAGHQYVHKGNKTSGLVKASADEEIDVVSDHLAVVFEHALNESEKTLLQHTADGIQLAARLTDMPANELHSEAFIEEARRVAKRTNAKVTVIKGEELRERGFGGIYGVGKAASHPPALVVLSYYPSGTSEETPGVALVGKGIVYDTGGYSLKPTAFMVGMKRDMGGAAGLLAAFQAAVLSKNSEKQPLHAVLCVAENAIGPLATKPDDVLTFYSGKTVEINNTDAEGRLVLADGAAYAVKHLNPKVLMDMATLTGAQGIATGNLIGAIYTNNEELEHIAVKAGKTSGDLVHPMPYAPEFYRSEFKSTIADMKNSVKNRANAQVSCAGQFVGNHLGEFETTGKWLHVDMAFPVKTDDDERATGFGVAFVQALLKEIDNAGW